MLLDLSDPQLLRGQALKGDQPAGPAWTAPVPAQTCRDGLPIARDALGDFIGDLLLEYSSPDAGLVMAMPHQLTHWRVLEWPDAQVPDDALEELLERAPDLGWPAALDDCCLDLQPQPGQPGASLLVGASRSALEAWVEVVAMAGGALRHLIPAQACLSTALQDSLLTARDGELVALLQPESLGHQLIVWRDGCPELQRLLPLQAEALIPELEQVLHFCRQRFAARGLRLLLADALELAPQLREALPDLTLDLVDPAPYGSLVLQGLAMLERIR